MKILCITEQAIHRPEARRWRDRMTNLHPQGEVVVVLPCSMKKPYSQSKTHGIFMRVTKGYQEAVLTSPFGICPREMERTYPIQSYDVSTTGEWSQEEIDITGNCLQEYVADKQVIAHVAGGYRKACEQYLDEAIYTCNDGRTTSPDSMNNLRRELKNYPKLKGRNRNVQKLRSIARYQFNQQNADLLIPDGSQIKGRFNQRIMHNKKQIATLLYDTGLFSLNLESGRILREMDRNWVKIDFDLQTNTLFAPGVIQAHPDIIPRDEVVILNDEEVIGVGKAVLTGEEMEKAGKGVAVRIRHRFRG
jgi:archaeosine synthase alpha-subunit